MRPPLLLVAAAFLVACADAPSAPLLEPMDASFGEWGGDPPPPWAQIDGDGTAYDEHYSWTGHILINPKNNLAWLRFTGSSDGSATFSTDARLISRNGKLTGSGTITVGGNTINLNTVETFSYESYRGTGFISFSAPNLTGTTRFREVCAKCVEITFP